MKRGEIWIVSARGYAGKPRPSVIVQSDEFGDLASVTICPFTTNEEQARFFRVPVAVTPENGLFEDSQIMADKIMTVPAHKFGKRLGQLGSAEMAALETALALSLGLAR